MNRPIFLADANRGQVKSRAEAPLAVFADRRVRGQASPRFEKRYFDAVSGRGDWWIGYDITLRFLGVAWRYREILLVDLLHNLDRPPEDKSAVLPRALERAKEMNRSRLAKAVQDFGSARAERLLAPVLERA